MHTLAPHSSPQRWPQSCVEEHQRSPLDDSRSCVDDANDKGQQWDPSSLPLPEASLIGSHQMGFGGPVLSVTWTLTRSSLLPCFEACKTPLPAWTPSSFCAFAFCAHHKPSSPTLGVGFGSLNTHCDAHYRLFTNHHQHHHHLRHYRRP